jgi:hypothetical protein
MKKRSTTGQTSIRDENPTIRYNATTHHWAHAEQIRWTLLYNYLMASTILLLAWATVFASDNSWRALLMTTLSIGGIFISVLWVGLGIRATGFVKMYASLGMSLESEIQNQTSNVTAKGPFSSAAAHRSEVKGLAKAAQSGFILKCVPILFIIIFGVLTFVSLS